MKQGKEGRHRISRSPQRIYLKKKKGGTIFIGKGDREIKKMRGKWLLFHRKAQVLSWSITTIEESPVREKAGVMGDAGAEKRES